MGKCNGGHEHAHRPNGNNQLNAQALLSGRGLYAITDGTRPDLLDVVAAVLRGGARVVQYRDETTDAARRHVEAAAIRQLCLAHAVPLIIEEDLQLAKSVGADGVHLAGGEADIAAARSFLGAGSIVGIACAGSLELARESARAGASYVSFGAFFKSPTKPLAAVVSIDLLRQSAALGMPRVAIGGITADNGRPLIDAGADYLAAISAVVGAADVAVAARRFTELFTSD